MSLSTTARQVWEKSTAVYKATLVDENGNPISGTSLTTLTLTLYNKADGSIINSRNAQDVLGKNNVTVGTDGVLTWTIQPEDNVIVAPEGDVTENEQHVAEWCWTWSTPAKTGRYPVTIEVKNLEKV